MLPFLKPEKVGAIIVARRKPDGSHMAEGGMAEDGHVENAELLAAATDLVRAVHAKDAKGVAEALEAAFYVCDAMPHEEGEHIEGYKEPEGVEE